MVRLRGRQITAGLDCGPGLPIILPSSWEDLVLTIDSKDGSFKILHGNREAINIFAPGDSIYHHNYNSSVKLQDSGNLVLRELNPDGSRKQILWQSFDRQTDTLLPDVQLYNTEDRPGMLNPISLQIEPDGRLMNYLEEGEGSEMCSCLGYAPTNIDDTGCHLWDRTRSLTRGSPSN
ncbi:G-type lectin S-receptor-like serine/threonine-protein kinase At1g67520 [Linum grandiflorum]